MTQKAYLTQSCGNVYCTSSKPCSSCCAPKVECCVDGATGPQGPTGPSGIPGPTGPVLENLTFVNSGPTGATGPQENPNAGDIYLYEPTNQLFFYNEDLGFVDQNGNGIPAF